MTRLPIGTPSQERFAQRLLYKYKILWEATNIGVVNLTFYSILLLRCTIIFIQITAYVVCLAQSNTKRQFSVFYLVQSFDADHLSKVCLFFEYQDGCRV